MFNLDVKQLGQAMPADTTAVSIYSPAENVVAHVRSVVICNNTASAVAFRLFHDNDGTTYSTATALYYDKEVPANDTYTHNALIFMDSEDANLAVRSATGNALTFTVYGAEET